MRATPRIQPLAFLVTAVTVATAATVAALAVVPPALAAPDPVPATASFTKAAGTVEPDAGRALTLATGQRIRLVGSGEQATVLVVDPGPPGPGRTLVTRRLGDRLYVYPAVAGRYLGGQLDPSLFDVTALAAEADGKLPVVMRYRGAAPDVPGVRLVSAVDGQARGYLTPESASRFGAALVAQWRSDTRSGGAQGSSSFLGVDGITAAGAAPGDGGGVDPHYLMRTVTIRVIGPDGLPAQGGSIGLINVEDGRRYSNFVRVQDGEGVASVPEGTYSLLGDQFGFDTATNTPTLAIGVVTDVAVAAAGAVLTVDLRGATVTPSAQVPQADAAVAAHYLEWGRRDIASVGFISTGYFLDPGTRVTLTPTAPVRYGTATLMQDWGLAGSGSDVYDLASRRDHIPATTAELADRFGAADLATVEATYYGDGGTAPAATLRYARYPGTGGASAYRSTPRGTIRIEHVGALGKPVWTDSAMLNPASTADQGTIFSPGRTLAPGTLERTSWFRGPLAAGVPWQVGAGSCWACRAGNTIGLGLAPFTDSDPTHAGSLQVDPAGTPVSRLRFYRGNELLADKNDSLGDAFAVSGPSADYRLVLDVDRRLNAPRQSTATTTEYGFRSASGEGAALPADWTCPLEACLVLPLVQARVYLPTALDGTLPAGRSSVTVQAGRIQAATAAGAVEAGLEFRAAGGDWTQVPLTGSGASPRTGSIDLTGVADGTAVDLRLQAADDTGGTFRQTVQQAFTVGGTR